MQESQLQHMLVTLRTRLLVMCATVGLSLDDACKALSESDIGRATAVIDGDAAINDLENEIDEKALTLLARTQPVACDLRFVVSALRMAIDLERIADEATSMAERTIIMKDLDMHLVLDEITELMELARKMFAAAVDAFIKGDIDLALEVRQHEDTASLLEVRMVQKIIVGMDKEIGAELAMHVILIARSLNRIWRRAANIAEHTYFIKTGVSLKHRAPKKST